MDNLRPSQSAGIALRKCLELNGMTQRVFAEEFNTEERTVNRYVNEGIGKVDLIQEIAAFFDLSLVEFLLLGK